MTQISQEAIQSRKTKLCFLDQDHPDDRILLDAAFNSLPGGPVARNDEYYESWQYMGTVYGWQGRERWVHQFRHRAHPDFENRRVYQNVAAIEPRQAILDKAF